jgi:hypothetical protein
VVRRAVAKFQDAQPQEIPFFELAARGDCGSEDRHDRAEVIPE